MPTAPVRVGGPAAADGPTASSREDDALLASPSAALRVTVAAGFCTTASLTGGMFLPLTAPSSLGQLPLALGLARRRQPLRCRRLWLGRRRLELLCHRWGDPHAVG